MIFLSGSDTIAAQDAGIFGTVKTMKWGISLVKSGF